MTDLIAYACMQSVHNFLVELQELTGHSHRRPPLANGYRLVQGGSESMTPSELERFLSAQDQGHPTRLEQALGKLWAGRKVSHWIWFVLPQLWSLGR